MKKAKPGARKPSARKPSAKRNSRSKVKAKIQTVTGYVARVPARARPAFSKLRATVRSAVPRAATEIISYRIPAFKHGRVLVWFAAFSDHCSLFPTNSIIEKFQRELSPFPTSKGTVQFPLNKPLPIALIKKMVKARVAEVAQRK
jgi:uncharacterized protein YdhG (YjbR/CyaY superfamily)